VRSFFVLMILVGLLGGVGYPFYMENLSGAELAVFRVYERSTGFKAIDVDLSANDAPVRIFLDMIPLQGFVPDSSRTMLTLTATTRGRTVLAASLSYIGADQSDRGPQSSEKVYRDRAGDIKNVDTGTYRFVVGEGDNDDLSMKSVDLILRADVAEADPRAMPTGLGIAALGLLGFVRSRKNTKIAAAAEEAKPKWGRDADQG
jgi:hypothetical protein